MTRKLPDLKPYTEAPADEDLMWVRDFSAARDKKIDIATFKALFGPFGPINVVGTSIDLSQEGTYYRLTLDGNVTLTFDNPSSAMNEFTLQVDHVSGEITWPASVVWPFDTPPAYAPGNKHLFMFVSDDGGTTYRGAALVDYPA